jgi:lysophospholipase L1-like esterase
MPRIVMMGDSSFNNANYVPRDQAVVEQLRKLLPEAWKVTMRAADKSTVGDLVEKQLANMPFDANYIFISAGGRNLLAYERIIFRRTKIVAETLKILSELRAKFEKDYEKMLAAVEEMNLPTCVCTIYTPYQANELMRNILGTALTVFNDTIIKLAGSRGFPVIDLRTILVKKEDFSDPMRPSIQGGEKMAKALKLVMDKHNFESRATAIYTIS